MTDNKIDIAIIDRAIASAGPGEQSVKFGDVGMRIADLKIFRDRLAGTQPKSQALRNKPNPQVVTPTGTTFKWPGGNVYYRFDPTQVPATITPAKAQQFRDSAAEWAAFANLHFIEITNVTGIAHYITVQEQASSEGGFSSSVGMDPVNAEQFVRIDPSSWNRGTVCHEIGHALGLYHEQQRDDRDTYVVIRLSNVDPSLQPNFTKIPGGSVAVGTYDFYSVMHYRRDELSLHPGSLDPSLRDTVEPQSAYSQFLDIMGNVDDRTLSKLDRASMAAVYGNPAISPGVVVTNTNDSGSGSLRSAIYYAFDRSTDTPPVPTVVTFHIPNTDANFSGGVFTIKPTYLLVAPGAGTTIDGATQTAFTGDTNPSGPEIVINGSQIAAQNLNLFASGFVLRETNCTVKNLVINGFNQQGIVIDGTTAALNGTNATGNVISGCYIGTDKTGSVAAPNSYPGIEILGGANHNTIGGITAATRNVISGNTHDGISIHDTGSSSNLIQGNYIGVNAAGTAPLPNTFSGLAIFDGPQSNTIGGTTGSAGNLISGNDEEGILMDGTNSNTVQGNFIGVNAAGIAALANQFGGIGIFGGSQFNTIGGTSLGARNLVSGNLFEGVAIGGDASNQNLVAGNVLGLDVTGVAAIGNGYQGVSIYGGAQSNAVGGTSPGTRNVIAANGYQIPHAYEDVGIQGAGTNNNVVQGNLIGLNAAGTAALPNSNTGVGIYQGAQNNTVGGTSAGARNFISGHADYGLFISDLGTNGNVVQGNTIGLNLTGSAVPNGEPGVAFVNNAQSNVLGGSIAGASNIISGNTNEGVAVDSLNSTTIGDTLSRNSIFANGGKGIALYNGGNNSQPFPTLSSAVLSTAGNPGGTDVAGSLTAAASTTYTIEFFASPTGDPSGFGEGQFFVGSTSVITSGAGTVSFTSSLAAAMPANYLITATATAPNGNTSEFSATRTVTTTDTDGDGIPDAWMNAHFSHPTGQAGDKSRASDDADGDGVTNLQEFKAGTDPKSATSVLRITSIDCSTGNPRISFPSVNGKTYRLEYRDNLTAGNWSPLLDGIFGTGATLQISDPSGTGLSKRFYRVSLEP